MIVVVVTEEEISDGGLSYFSDSSQHCLQHTEIKLMINLSGPHLGLVVVHGIHHHDPLLCDHKHGHVEPVVREAVHAISHLLAGRETLLGEAELALLSLLAAGVGEDAEAGGENQKDFLHHGVAIWSGLVRRWRGRFILFRVEIHCAEKYVAVHHQHYQVSIGNLTSEFLYFLLKII